MSLVVVIDSGLTDHAEEDMRRWWHYACRKHVRSDEVFFEVSGKFNLYEGVKRLASFGVKARVARREVTPTMTDSEKDDDPEIFDVTVWDHEGNIIKKLWEATIDEALALQEEYADDPLKNVVIEERQ